MKRGNKMYKIMIVEDDIEIREELKILLQNNGYEVKVTTNFENVEKQILEEQCHLILLDINLPNKNGYEICSKIRTKSKLPIIFVTSRNSSMDELNGIMLGGDDYIEKPYNVPVLLARIQNLLNRVYPKELKSRKEQLIFQAECSTDKDMTNLSKKYDQMNNNLDILDSQDISLKKQLEKDAAAFREEKFRPEPEQYTELLDTRIQIRPDFRDKLIEQLKGTFGKYYDYHRRDIAANEVDYLNAEDPDVFSHRAWELEYQRKQEMRRNQPARTKKKSYDMEL